MGVGAGALYEGGGGTLLMRVKVKMEVEHYGTVSPLSTKS